MLPKIVFFDIDGTLLDHDKNIPESTIRAIVELQEKGVITAIATGRAPFMHQSIRERLRIMSSISYNGQYVLHEGETIYHRPFSKKDLLDLHELTDKHHHPVTYMGSETMGATHDNHPFIRKGFEYLKLPPPEFKPNFYKDQAIYQALLFFEKDALPDYLDHHERFEAIQWFNQSMDVIPKGGGKKEGIKAMLDYFGLNPSEAAAFGDGLNDIGMLGYVGHGIAMGNAVPEAKQAASAITSNVDEDGVAVGLRKLGLISF